MINRSLNLLVICGPSIDAPGNGVRLGNEQQYEWAIDDLIAAGMIQGEPSSDPNDPRTRYRCTPKGRAVYESLCSVLSAHLLNYGPVPEDWPNNH